MVIGLEKHHIDLTVEEAALLSKIDLRITHSSHHEGRSAYLSNQEPIMVLLKLLSDRRGIPDKRLRYWTDPNFQLGRTKGSHKDIFAKNGSTGREAYTHPHFLPFLRYFLYGADLPASAIIEFEKQVGNPEFFSGSDIIDLTKKTRAIVRKFDLSNYRHADEFHKLAIDNGLNHYHSSSVRKAAVDAARR